ncbi:single stranded DNA-binding domain-containing protein [Streptomyces mirabilis]|uniref:hypothetical protein n=1 Tax=Streptomyces mirabilis TaxID=68239 RepID=UPI003681B647
MSITRCNGKNDVEGYDYNGSSSEELFAAHVAACHERTYEGAVLRLRERNGYDDSDFLADVWDAEAGRVRTVQYATTRGWTYHNGASIDATREVIELAVAWETEVRFADWQQKHAETARKGYTARAVEKDGTAVEGVIAWIGEKRQYSAWAARYADPVARYGIKVEGRQGLVFANADDEGFEFDAEPVSAEDMIEWRAQCEANVRAEFRQAQALADQREPLPAAPAPGTIVDAQEADADGWRLYAVGESFAEYEWTTAVALAVVTEEAADYVITGARADGSIMGEREGTSYRARGIVARWAENDETMIMHDGAGAVRMVREDGAWLELRPVRPEEAAGAPQEDGETREAHKGAETAVEGTQGTEGDPAWVARRDEALGALLGLLDGGAGRYRRTVLGKDGADGLSDTMPTSVVRAYLAEEVADGGEVGRRGMSGGLLLVRANGARLEFRPERGVALLAG